MTIELMQSLAAYRPTTLDMTGNRLASVALLVGNAGGEQEILFIERSAHDGDPWSGQVAFPGGGKEEHDADELAAACRETWEEVGVNVGPKQCIGRIDDQQGSTRGNKLDLTISCFVFALPDSPSPNWNHEVASAFWIPVRYLRDPDNVVTHQTVYRESPFPAVSLPAGQVLWGLTYRFVQNFLAIIP